MHPTMPMLQLSYPIAQQDEEARANGREWMFKSELRHLLQTNFEFTDELCRCGETFRVMTRSGSVGNTQLAMELSRVVTSRMRSKWSFDDDG